MPASVNLVNSKTGERKRMFSVDAKEFLLHQRAKGDNSWDVEMPLVALPPRDAAAASFLNRTAGAPALESVPESTSRRSAKSDD
jgi:hypothetical protein